MSVALVVEHEASCPIARLGDWLRDAGVELDVRRPYLGDDLPDDLSEHDALVVLGGSMDHDSSDAHPWLPDVEELVRGSAATPVLGICLGHQIVASALGGTVGPNPYGAQAGVLNVGWTPHASRDALMSGLPAFSRALHWNNDVLTALPPEAVVLAYADGDVQAVSFGSRTWGVQFHPEVDGATVREWVELEQTWLDRYGVDGAELVRAVDEAWPELERTWQCLAQAFAGVVGSGR